jgi:hypothetical protein
MLSFMREQESRTASEPSRDAGPPDSGASNIPETQEYLTVAANSKSLRRSTILVAALVGIGLVCLLLMIRKSQPQGAAAATGKNDQSKIEAAINRLTGVRSEMSGHMDEIVKKFYEFSDVVQVRVGELAKNPFEEENAAPDLRPVIATDSSLSQAEMARWQQLEQQARKLKLLSIMRSEQGDCCMINDQILAEGDMVGPFTIARVGSNFVELAWPAGGASDVGTPNLGEMKTLLKLSE